ncbi:MAG: NADH-quinone oxidoreductase subunit M [Phycisphaerales bacterium]|nr:NADH-quinone oxidoreductase subunit M [Phycisphaerales bacterium]
MLIWTSLLAPLAAAVAIAFAPKYAAKWIALVGTLASAAVTIVLALEFPDWISGKFWPSEPGPIWMEELGISLSVGYDSVSLLLALLTVFLMPLCILGSFSAINERVREYYGYFMLLHASMLLAFAAKDAILFYVGYEFTLVPMLLLIAIWGGAERRPAAIKFFLYTFFASLFMLAAILYVAWERRVEFGAWSFDIDLLISFSSSRLPQSIQFWVFAALIAGFAVKIPLFPVHTWLPLAHDQAPTAGSVILAGTLLKLGTYGAYRLAIPLVPAGGVELINVCAVLCIIAILYAALICWVQHDAKKLVAYSSVSHLGVCMLGLFALNPIGAEGAVFMMISHGLSTGAIFLCIGMVYERYHTKDMDLLGGLSRRMPVWSFFMVFFTLASLGLPGLNGFVGEFLCLMGTFIAEHDAPTGYMGVLGPGYAVVAALGLIFAAMYLLIMLGKLVWGPLREPPHGHGGHSDGRSALPTDLNLREIITLAPIAIVCLWMGLQPKPILEAVSPSVERVLADYPALVERMYADHSQPVVVAPAVVAPAETQP